MEIFCSNKQLIKNIFFVNTFQNVFVNRMVKISLHVLKYQVYIPIIFGNEDLMKLNYVSVRDFFENGNLSEGSLSISRMLEGFEYLF
jgi:hypothetical protein